MAMSDYNNNIDVFREKEYPMLKGQKLCLGL
jgi:hypothetical protein